MVAQENLILALDQIGRLLLWRATPDELKMLE
jgi:hypothetical protein